MLQLFYLASSLGQLQTNVNKQNLNKPKKRKKTENRIGKTGKPWKNRKKNRRNEGSEDGDDREVRGVRKLLSGRVIRERDCRVPSQPKCSYQ